MNIPVRIVRFCIISWDKTPNVEMVGMLRRCMLEVVSKLEPVQGGPPKRKYKPDADIYTGQPLCG